MKELRVIWTRGITNIKINSILLVNGS